MGIPSTIYCIHRSIDHNIQSRSSKFNDFFIKVNHVGESCLKTLWRAKLRVSPPACGDSDCGLKIAAIALFSAVLGVFGQQSH